MTPPSDQPSLLRSEENNLDSQISVCFPFSTQFPIFAESYSEERENNDPLCTVLMTMKNGIAKPLLVGEVTMWYDLFGVHQ